MSSISPHQSRKKRIRVCINVNCCSRGSEKVYTELKQHLDDATHEVYMSEDCFRFCKSGPNVSVEGNVLHDMRPETAVKRVQKEIEHPSKKIDGLGSRSIDELDDVLEDLFL